MKADLDASRDMLRFDFINSLGQLYAETWYGWWWPIIDIEVRTGLLRIDVCGMSECKHIGDIRKFKDDSGKEYETDDFYIDSDAAQVANKPTGEGA